MLFNALNPLLKYLLVASGYLSSINQVFHNLIVGFLLVGVGGFDFEVKRVLSRLEGFLSGFESLKTRSLLLLDMLYGRDISDVPKTSNFATVSRWIQKPTGMPN
jgi:hypothetical protein